MAYNHYEVANHTMKHRMYLISDHLWTHFAEENTLHVSMFVEFNTGPRDIRTLYTFSVIEGVQEVGRVQTELIESGSDDSRNSLKQWQDWAISFYAKDETLIYSFSGRLYP